LTSRLSLACKALNLIPQCVLLYRGQSSLIVGLRFNNEEPEELIRYAALTQLGNDVGMMRTGFTHGNPIEALVFQMTTQTTKLTI
jgi:hypothetical protein